MSSGGEAMTTSHDSKTHAPKPRASKTHGANMQGANMQGANMQGANMQGASTAPEAVVTPDEEKSGAEVMSGSAEAMRGQTATTGGQTTLLPWAPDQVALQVLTNPALEQAPADVLLGGEPLTSAPEPDAGNGEGPVQDLPSAAPSYTKSEVAGFSITVVGILLALFLLYLYVFSGLTGARNQNQLLHSVTSNPQAVFNLATGGKPRNGQAVAILDIPSISLHAGVVEGTTAADLQIGPGLVSTSGVSGIPGEPGDAVIAGRRVSFGAPFGRLSSLRIGDSIHVVDGAGSFNFVVTSVGTISKGSISVPSYGRSWLTLVTSNSSWMPTGKFVVVARIAGQPATATASGVSSSRYPLPSFSGDPAAGIPAALWAFAFIVVLGLMVFAIRRWRQTWVSWLLAAPVLLACGLFACESLARCLPSTL